jgi:hypothetical protein
MNNGMKEFSFGDINNRHILVRVFFPYSVRSIFTRYGWGVDFNHTKEINYRCYCPVGRSVWFRVVAFGVTFCLWYSYYDGVIPCVCDKALEELEG